VTGAPLPAVRLEGVCVSYGGVPALRDVSLVVSVGERVALLGPSGAGKSTLLGLLNGTVVPDAGTVTVLGEQPAALGPARLRALRTRIGTVPQRLDLVGPLRVVHNVNAGRLARWSLGRALWSLVRPQGLPEVLAALERVGLADRVHDRCEDLSGGQQQRVALARLLVQDPELLLTDEPVSSLDPALAAQVLDLLSGLAADGRTLLTSLHDPVLAARTCDRLVGLREGRVVLDLPAPAVATGTLDALYRTAS
jgi:phosphonate transport system ATP-binding protein